MRLAALTAAGLLATTSIAAAQTALGPLVTPEELQGALDDVRVIDIRPEGAFGDGHIGDAVVAPYALFRGPEENPGQIVPADDLQQAYRDLGLSLDDHVVISYAGSDISDFGAAARVYWTLKSSGFENLSILNGGIAAWTEAGLELDDEVTSPEASQIEVTWSPEWTASAEDVQQVLNGEDEALLLDARPEGFWSGNQSHPSAAKPGTLPQSEYFEHAGWFAEGPAIIDASAARSLADEQNFSDAGSIISFCNTGHWAATNWFALSELAEVGDVKLYPESMVGWSNAGYEMANVPGPLKTLWNNITSAF
ncbi:sulfurtransferase [Palleronia abyssalis]|uniref:Thiosulfate sulfurtransferase n=1 Tax=Palleronia abyssalis TaxID=1501240 RepID=A0A2R8BXM4_9RHOB|nr:rhodanese-like domain-containing protein [Palleronia abyssalis]SPJ24899.1 Putative thiosulfate sulfurtransferase [Palleronia abyssalis]